MGYPKTPPPRSSIPFSEDLDFPADYAEKLRLEAEARNAARPTGTEHTPAPTVKQWVDDSKAADMVDRSVDATGHSVVTPPDQQEVIAETGQSENQAEKTGVHLGLLDFPTVGQMRGSGQVVEGPEETFLPMGGAEGKLRWERMNREANDTYDAMKAGGQAEADRSAQLADFYKKDTARQNQEAAVLAQRRQENNAVLQAKLDNVMKTTQKWSNDLADTGKYWKNPFNVLSAIATSFMTLGTHDPTIAQNIISGAIRSDWEARRTAADMELGELRSNIGQFRQIAGDKELGDALAFADANRVAAMEIQRIGQTFEGPIAKAKAAATAANFMQRSQEALAQIYAKMSFNAAHLADPRIAKANAATSGMESGYHQYATQGQPAAFGKPMGAAKDQGTSASYLGPGGHAEAQADAITKLNGGMSKQDAAMYERRWKGLASIKQAADRATLKEAIINARGNPNNVDIERQKIVNKYAAEAQDLGKRAQPIVARAKFSQNAQNEINKIKVALSAAGVDPNEWLGRTKDLVPEKVDLLIRQFDMKYGSKSGPEAEQAMAHKEALNSFRQMVAMGVANYYRSVSGGAITNTELPRLEQIIQNDSSFQTISSFFRKMSQDSAAEIEASISGGHPLAQAIVLADLGNRYPGLNTEGVKGPIKKGPPPKRK